MARTRIRLSRISRPRNWRTCGAGTPPRRTSHSPDLDPLATHRGTKPTSSPTRPPPTGQRAAFPGSRAPHLSANISVPTRRVDRFDPWPPGVRTRIGDTILDLQPLIARSSRNTADQRSYLRRLRSTRVSTSNQHPAVRTRQWSPRPRPSPTPARPDHDHPPAATHTLHRPPHHQSDATAAGGAHRPLFVLAAVTTVWTPLTTDTWEWREARRSSATRHPNPAGRHDDLLLRRPSVVTLAVTAVNSATERRSAAGRPCPLT